MDFSRLRQGEIVAGIGGIALFVFLFFDWFQGTDGWTSLASPEVGGGVTGFIVALASIAAITFAALAAMGKRLNVPVPRGGITLALGGLAMLIILWTIIVAPEGAEIKFGLFLGLAAAVAITVGALLSRREDGWEPLVAMSAAGARSSGSSARPATTRRAASTLAKSSSSSGSSRSSSGTRKTSTRKSTTSKSGAKRSSSRSSSAKKK